MNIREERGKKIRDLVGKWTEFFHCRTWLSMDWGLDFTKTTGFLFRLFPGKGEVCRILQGQPLLSRRFDRDRPRRFVPGAAVYPSVRGECFSLNGAHLLKDDAVFLVWMSYQDGAHLDLFLKNYDFFRFDGTIPRYKDAILKFFII